MAEAPTPGALDGITVVDLSRVLAGPHATMILGDLGADVVKIERPHVGDDTRTWGPPFVDGTSTYFQATNRNKRSITADLTTPEGRAPILAMLDGADVLVENFKPGTMARWGMDPADLVARHPRLVVCTITGFGSTPAARELPGYDLLVQGASGLMSITGDADGPPTKVGVAAVDVLCSLYVTIGVLAALQERERSGRGQHLEVSLLDCALAALVNQMSGYLLAGQNPTRLGNDHPSIVPYGVYPAADGDFIVACGNDRQFAAIASVLERPDLAADDRFATNGARVAHRDELDPVLRAAFVARPRAHWVPELTRAGVPAGGINSVAEAVELATALGVEPVVELHDDAGVFPSIRSPLRLARTPATVRRRPPALGADNPGDD
ncbi:MAG TPA: CoA transferase [Acidimicrobiia bacterium]|jgi:crotonobetainyl-CoA:carnitine CoA-transferase CaiB-like acyl-CoA transferase